jgi:hypothetical protein
LVAESLAPQQTEHLPHLICLFEPFTSC